MSEKSLPELTIRSVLLGVFLSVILAGANAYLGLFAGMTVSASIPAAVISMGVLKLLKKSNVLENNIVQTAASAGESVTAGVIFTLPALVMLGYWDHFDYLWVTVIAAFGGILGVLFTIPLRRSLIIEEKLQFPEGVATAEVLQTGQEGGQGVRIIAKAAVGGALFKLGAGKLFGVFANALEGARAVGSSVAYFGLGLSPALLSVGYIVGMNIAVLIFVGGAMNWLIAIPVVSIVEGGCPADMSAVDWSYMLWSTKTRYIGVGGMLIGGLWTIFQMRRSLLSGITSGLKAYQLLGDKSAKIIDRRDKDIPMNWVIVMVVACIVPVFLIYQTYFQQASVSIVMAIVMILTGFIFSAVAGYMAGLVGSSNNPLSGVTISTVLVSSLLLLLLLGSQSEKGAVGAIIVSSVVCCACAIAGDNMQDLKAGRLVGATPWKQQLMQIVGTISGAVVLAPILSLLHEAYRFKGEVGAGEDALAAPQASLMGAVASGVFNGDLPWIYFNIGIATGIAIILADLYLYKKGSSFRMPVLAVAIGIYLPFELAVPIFIGGLIHLAIQKALQKRKSSKEQVANANRTGLLFASGLITGEAIMGILLAVPIVVLLKFFEIPKKAFPLLKLYKMEGQTGTVFGMWDSAKAEIAQQVSSFSDTPLAGFMGGVLLFVVIIWMYRTVVNSAKD